MAKVGEGIVEGTFEMVMRKFGLVVLALGALSLGVLVGCGKKAPAENPEAKLDRPVLTEDIKVGEGEAVGEAYRVMVEYVGRFPGSEAAFDRNDTKTDKGVAAKTPLSFKIGGGTVVKGMEEGMVGMKKGGVRKMTIPWQKGYGVQGSSDGNVPPEQDMEFTVTLLDFVGPLGEGEYDFTDVREGSGAAVKDGDKVTVHYRSTYTNGMLFDDSRVRGEPLVFRVGNNDVIKGVDVAIVGMKVGGIRKMWIPPMLAFGEEGYQTIQGGQIILVEVELLKIEP